MDEGKEEGIQWWEISGCHKCIHPSGMWVEEVMDRYSI